MNSFLRIVQAQVSTVPTDPLSNTFGSNATLANIFGLIINVAIGVGIALTVIFLILGGIQYMSAKGDKNMAEEARQALTNAIIGFVVVLGAVTIKFVVGNLLNVDQSAVNTITPF